MYFRSMMFRRMQSAASLLLSGLLIIASTTVPIAAADEKVPDNQTPPSATAAESQDGDTTKAPAPAENPDPAAKASEDSLPEGHSVHGEVFNDGPRQAAYLMDGMGIVHFPVTTASDEARRFLEQGVAQLHGFWYFESERSFRQAAMLDPDCAIAYWGMAMSNRKNADRAKGFIKEAMARKDKASRRERLYIEAFDRFINAKSGSEDEKRDRCERYISDLESLLFEFPDDIEAKAFMTEFFWSSRSDGLKTVSYLTIDAMIQDVLDVEPLHPVHHYRIHLWDGKKPEKALESAARGGLAAPGIAHMWHMPGHIYSRLKRYHDAVYQQEASARVDHAHMMKDLVLPDQIHNFAHNNEWCIRNLIYIGRVHDAIALAQNMMSMPRHPKYNHIDKSGSYKYGRQRLIQVLRTYAMHEQILALKDTPWLENTGSETEDLARDRAVGAAFAATGQKDQALAIVQALTAQHEKITAEKNSAGDKAEKEAKDAKKDEKAVAKARKDAMNKFSGRLNEVQRALDEIEGRLAAGEGRFDDALQLLKKANGTSVEEQVAVMVSAGKVDDAIKKIADRVRTSKGEVLPLAAQVETLWNADRKDEARKAFEQLREISATIDLDIPCFSRLSAIAQQLGFEGDWRVDQKLADDIGARPNLDSLGPFRWQPVTAPQWSLRDMEDKTRSLSDYRERPLVVIF
ncbi:MAG: alkyl hydroperoxide reductase, partial [Planctomycetaceae bacterium]|nr:alkyl hydroperoxide reductase [Planctomycetaceae bacterium]